MKTFQKIVLTKDYLVGKKIGFFGLKKNPDKTVYRVISSVNFPARKFYFPKELDYLMDIGVKLQIKNKR